MIIIIFKHFYLLVFKEGLNLIHCFPNYHCIQNVIDFECEGLTFYRRFLFETELSIR